MQLLMLTLGLHTACFTEWLLLCSFAGDITVSWEAAWGGDIELQHAELPNLVTFIVRAQLRGSG